RRRFQSVLFQLRQNEEVDGVMGPGSHFDFGPRRSFRFDEGPMRRVGRALFNPAFDQVDLRRVQSPAGLWRRHHIVWVRRRDAPDQFAVPGIARRDGTAAFAFLNGFLPDIEPEFRLARTFVRPVATETFAGGAGADLRAEIDGLAGRPNIGAGQGGGDRSRGYEYRRGESGPIWHLTLHPISKDAF